MAIGAVTGGGAGGVQAAGQSLTANFDNFLKLLTTQLQNQDPLAPMDANAFTSQLVQFASVEQAIKTNDKLKELGGLMEAGGTSSAMSMLGREAVVATDRVGLGSKVTVVDLETDETETYQLVLAEMMDIDAGHISLASPLGRALKDRKVGEEVLLRLPTLVRRLRVTDLVTVHQME